MSDRENPMDAAVDRLEPNELAKRTRSRRVLIGLVGLILAAAALTGWGLWLQQNNREMYNAAADDRGRVIVDEHTTPRGYQVRVGRGPITYESRTGSKAIDDGLMIEVALGEDRWSQPFPLPAPQENVELLGSFFTGIAYFVFAAPPDTVLAVTFADGEVEQIDVGGDGIAVVVAHSFDDVTEVRASTPDGTSCRIYGAPSPDAIDCAPN